MNKWLREVYVDISKIRKILSLIMSCHLSWFRLIYFLMITFCILQKVWENKNFHILLVGKLVYNHHGDQFENIKCLNKDFLWPSSSTSWNLTSIFNIREIMSVQEYCNISCNSKSLETMEMSTFKGLVK